MTLTYIDIYNKITGQAWSMFDSEAETKEDFEANVTTSIQKALSDLWLSFPYSFRKKTHILKTRTSRAFYEAPIGNIKEDKGVWIGTNYLNYLSEYRGLEEKEGTPEYYYIKDDKIYFYPTPDSSYIVSIDYLALNPACDEEGEEKATLENDTDYINIPERYEQLFLHTLMPLTMWNYLIASESDENSSAYEKQYRRAYKHLLDYCGGVETEKKVGW